MKRLLGYLIVPVLAIILGSCTMSDYSRPVAQQQPFKRSRYSAGQIDSYLQTHKLDIIEGVWIYSFSLYSEIIMQGKGRQTDTITGVDCDEFFIVKDDLSISSRYLLIYNRELKDSDRKGKYNHGEILATIEQDILDPNSFYFYFDQTYTQLGAKKVQMYLYGDTIKGKSLDTSQIPGLSMTLDHSYSYRKAKSSNLVKNGENVFTGTGFVLNEEGFIATNQHVIEGGANIHVSFPESGMTYDARIVSNDKNNDLAILKLNGFTIEEISGSSIPYSITSSAQASIGNIVFTLGYPLTGVLGESIKYSGGSITSAKDYSMSPVLMQIDNNIQPGNSGSPLFDNNGSVIGIVVSSLNAKFFLDKGDFVPQNVNFAIRSDYLLPLISSLNIKPVDQLLASNFRKMSIEDKIAAITPFICIIKTDK